MDNCMSGNQALILVHPLLIAEAAHLRLGLIIAAEPNLGIAVCHQ